MQINVSKALKLPGELFPIDLVQELEPQQFAGRTLEFTGPVQVHATYVYDGKALTVQGTIQVSLQSRCALCGEPFSEPLVVAFQERFIKALNSPEDDTYVFEGDVIDLEDAVLDNLYLQLPIASVCKEDCKGLCPICGCNFNTTHCSCMHEADVQTRNPLAALEQLLNDGKEV